jgi:hypothetical protein
VVVTIDRCRLQTPTSVWASRDARMRRLVGLSPGSGRPRALTSGVGRGVA